MAEADREAVRTFLAARRDLSLFLLTGLAGEGPQPFRLWLAEGPGGEVEGVVALSGGYLLPQWPGGDWARARDALAGQEVAGAAGPLEQVGPLLAGLGLAEGPLRAEPVLALDLADLAVPEGEGRLLPDGAGDPALVLRWRAAFRAELHGTPAGLSAERAARDLAAGLGGDRFRLLAVGAEPVAMTGFTARAEGAALVGRVFVPPERRGRGHARRAVALHLAEARTRPGAAGVHRAVLAASGPAAERAYRAIGFRPVGQAGSADFERPRTVGAAHA